MIGDASSVDGRPRFDQRNERSQAVCMARGRESNLERSRAAF